MIVKNVPTLKIHKLTKEQYDAAVLSDDIDEDALYLTPDEGCYTVAVQSTEPTDSNVAIWIKTTSASPSS